MRSYEGTLDPSEVEAFLYSFHGTYQDLTCWPNLEAPQIIVIWRADTVRLLLCPKDMPLLYAVVCLVTAFDPSMWDSWESSQDITQGDWNGPEIES